ncbi:Ig-like domain-containing protein [Streptococcus cuniculi]|nr:Ig-like domain-containing protein [Streptococcus cuniculi]MBF0779278.1 YSIRK-type signal peptide-containing protein [Streptococcus cuniculi]
MFSKRIQIFSIRKFSVGVCSVLLASTLLGAMSPISQVVFGGETVVHAAEAAELVITESRVGVGLDNLTATVTATSGATFTVKVGEQVYPLTETPNGDGTSKYAVNTPLNRTTFVQAAELSYSFNGKEGKAAFDEYVLLQEKLVSGTQKRITKTNSTPLTAEEVAQIKQNITSMYAEAGYPIADPDTDIVVDTANDRISVKSSFETDTFWNLFKEYTGVYKLSSFVQYQSDVVQNRTVKLSNTRIGGSFFAPRGGRATLTYGDQVLPMMFFSGNYTLVDRKVPKMIRDTIVTFNLTNADGTTETRTIDVTDGDATRVPMHVQAEDFFVANPIKKLSVEDKAATLTAEQEAAIIKNIEDAVAASPFKDQVEQVYATSNDFIVRFKNQTLSDGTIVSYEYYISPSDLTQVTAQVTGKVKIWDNADARQFNTGLLTGSQGSTPNGQTELRGYTSVPVKLLDESGNLVQEVNSGAGGTLGDFSFDEVGDGTYYIEIGTTNTVGVPHEVLDLPALQEFGVPFQNANRSKAIIVENGQVRVKDQVEIDQYGNPDTDESGNTTPVSTVLFAVVRQPYALRLHTDAGAFVLTGADGAPLDFGGDLTLFEGGLRYFEQNGNKFASLHGVLFNDRPNNLINSLPEPVLSQEDKDYGYEFVGWRIDDVMVDKYPELAGQLFSTEEALNIVAKGDIDLRATFAVPEHTVTFATDTDKGLINGGASVSVKVEGNTTKISAIANNTLPEPVAKPGYEFVGWFVDPTTNVVDKDTILGTVVNRNLVYYAKYRPVAQEVTPEPLINPVTEGGTTVTGVGVAGATVTVTFPDGSTVDVVVGKDNTWSVTAPAPLTLGQVVSAKQLVEGKDPSSSVDVTVVPKTAEVSANPIIHAMFVGDVAVTGKGVPGASIIVTFKDRTQVTTKVGADGTWAVQVPATATLAKGDNVSVTQIEPGKKVSAAVDGTVLAPSEKGDKGDKGDNGDPGIQKNSDDNQDNQNDKDNGGDAGKTTVKPKAVLPRTGTTRSNLSLIGLVGLGGLLAYGFLNKKRSKDEG